MALLNTADSIRLGSKVVSSVYLGVTKIWPTVIEYIYKFLGITVTNPDGTRSLVNDGTSGVNADLFTGQGLAFEGSQYVNTGVALDYNNNHYFAVTFKSDLPNGIFVADAGGFALQLRINNGKIATRLDSLFLDIGDDLDLNEPHRVVFHLDKTTYRVRAFLDGVYHGMADYTLVDRSWNGLHFSYIGARIQYTDSRFSGILSNIIKLAGSDVISDADLIEMSTLSHPDTERHLYKENGVLKSSLASVTDALLTRSTNLWIPFNKFTTDGTNWFTKNLCTDEDKVITGMSSDTLITNADQLPYGYQNALVNDDLTLKVIDWQATDNADLTAQALTEDNLDVVITGDPATNIKVYEV